MTRGAGFRKEKNKKKRGSYRGGEITVSGFTTRYRRDGVLKAEQMQSYSIKFND